MIPILLLDQDCHYTRHVCAKINSLSGPVQCFDDTTYPFRDADTVAEANYNARSGQDGFPVSVVDHPCHAVDLSLLGIDWDHTLVIYNPQQFYHPPVNAYTMILLEAEPMAEPMADSEMDPDTHPRMEGSVPSRSDGSSVPGLYKYCSIGQMLKTIEGYLIHHSGLSARYKNADLLCVLGTACPARRLDSLARIHQEKLESGQKVVQIDFCPPHFIGHPAPDSIGYTMTDAFLRIMADDFSFEDLGVFLVPGTDGILYFRPVERADDLFEPGPDHVRKFMESVRKWISHTNRQYFVVIQCYAVPFAFVNTIAVLCDELLLVNEDGPSPRNTFYTKELAHLLANLPGSCKVREIRAVCPAGDNAGHGRTKTS